MPAWLAPALKAVLPHLGTIVSAVAPAFTSRKADATSNQMQLMQVQIAELQSAASQNATHIKELATQLQNTVSTLEQAAAMAETRIRRAFWSSVIAMTLAAAGLITTALLLLTR